MAETTYLALYRKYRPLTFDDVRGRDAIVRTLKNQIAQGRTSHSYLFCGTRGTGKTTIAKIFAKAVNCETPRDGSPCGVCPSCRAIAEDASLNVVEMDAASNNGVDDIRSIIEEVSYSPTQGKKRVYIIDEVHMLSNAAFNALLKTLEEPPSYAVFILATTEPNKLPITILSRCQRYDFGRLSVATIEDRLKEVSELEHLEAETKALHYIAGAADGSMRDGLSLLDQCNAFNFGNGPLTFERTLEILGAVDGAYFSRLYRHIHTGDAANALRDLDAIVMKGGELVQFVADFLKYLRNLMLLKASERVAEDLDLSGENLERILEDARDSEMPEILRNVRIFSELTEQIRYAADRRILTEAALIRAARPSMGVDIDSLLTRQHELEAQLAKLASKLGDLERRGVAAGPASAIAPAVGPEAVQNHGQTAGEAGHNANGAPAAPVRAANLPNAVPEEVRQVVGQWKKVLSIMADGYYKAYLRTARLSVSPEGKLLFVFNNSVAAAPFARSEEGRIFVEDAIAEVIGKRVSTEYKLLDSDEKFTDNYVDLLREKVSMQIEVEEDF